VASLAVLLVTDGETDRQTETDTVLPCYSIASRGKKLVNGKSQNDFRLRIAFI